jgi:hypothetical protein
VSKAGLIRALDGVSLTLAWVGLALIGLGLSRLASLEVVGTAPFSSALALTFVLAGVVLILIFLLVWILLHRLPAVPERSEDHVEQAAIVPTESVEFDRVSTVLLLINPTSYCSRVVETVEPKDGYYVHRVTVDYTLPPRQDAALVGPSTYLIPVLRLARGSVVDNVRVSDASGARLATLNVRDFAGIARANITNTLNALADGVDLPAEVTELLEETLAVVTADGPLMGTAEAEERQRPESRWEKALEGLARPSRWDGQVEEWRLLRSRLAHFCDAVADGHVVLAPVPGAPGEMVTIDCCYTRGQRFERKPAAKLDSLRYLLGLRPYKHNLTLTEHRLAQSYHLEFRAPADQYLFECSVSPVEDRRNAGRAKGNLVVFPRGGSGARDYAHVYVRQAQSERPTSRAPLLVRLDCREKAPGLLGIVAMIVVAQALLIWFVGAFHHYYFPDDQVTGASASTSASAASTDVPALLFALPGLAAAWLGAQLTPERLRATSLATVVGTLLAVVLAIASTAGAVAKSAGGLAGSVFSIAHPAWLAVMLFSAVLAIDLSVRAVVRGIRFTRRINHPGVVERQLM